MDGITGTLEEKAENGVKKLKNWLQYKGVSTIIGLSYLRINFAAGKYDKDFLL